MKMDIWKIPVYKILILPPNYKLINLYCFKKTPIFPILQQSQLMMNGYESIIQTQEKRNIFVSINVGNNYDDTLNWVGLFFSGKYKKARFPPHQLKLKNDWHKYQLQLFIILLELEPGSRESHWQHTGKNDAKTRFSFLL